MFIKTKTPLINANLVPLSFGTNGAVLLAPASTAASRVQPWRQMHVWLAALLGCTLAPFLAALLDCYGSCLPQCTFSQIMFKWFKKLHYYNPWRCYDLANKLFAIQSRN